MTRTKDEIIKMLQAVEGSIVIHGLQVDPLYDTMKEPRTTILENMRPSSLNYAIDATIKFIKENVK